jgi:formamidopyrimidine-DNA glycosylase
VPEGHTIHRLARDLRAAFGGEQVGASSPQGRFALPAAHLDGRMLDRADAHGKHLFVRFGGPDPLRWLHVHLGLFGRFTLESRADSQPAPDPRGAVRLRLEGRRAVADLRGPTICAVLDDDAVRAVQARLGDDPLRPDADPERAVARLSRRLIPAGAVLLDQSVVAGVGNVYRAEVLYRAGVHPFRPAGEVPPEIWRGVWDDLVVLMRSGVRSGRIVTTERDDRGRRSGPARRSDAHYVYGRAGLPCRRCGTPVLAEVLAARTVSWCPVCQRDS